MLGNSASHGHSGLSVALPSGDCTTGIMRPPELHGGCIVTPQIHARLEPRKVTIFGNGLLAHVIT